MSLILCDSSNICAMGYDKETKQLTVIFHGGAGYMYEDVPASTWSILQRDESTGSTFHELIKVPGYKFRKLGKIFKKWPDPKRTKKS